MKRKCDCFTKHSTSFSSILMINVFAFYICNRNILWIFIKLRAKESLSVWCDEGLNPGLRTCAMSLAPKR